MPDAEAAANGEGAGLALEASRNGCVVGVCAGARVCPRCRASERAQGHLLGITAGRRDRTAVGENVEGGPVSRRARLEDLVSEGGSVVQVPGVPRRRPARFGSKESDLALARPSGPSQLVPSLGHFTLPHGTAVTAGRQTSFP